MTRPRGRAKTKLRFDKVEKPAPKLKAQPGSRPVQEAGLYRHGKIHEVGAENVGVEGGHKGKNLPSAKREKAIRSGIRRHKLKPYRAAAKAEKIHCRQCRVYLPEIFAGQPGTGAGGEKSRVPVLAETENQTGLCQGSTGGGQTAGRGSQRQRPPRRSRQESRREKKTGRVPCGPSLERGAADRRRGPACSC